MMRLVENAKADFAQQSAILPDFRTIFSTEITSLTSNFHVSFLKTNRLLNEAAAKVIRSGHPFERLIQMAGESTVTGFSNCIFPATLIHWESRAASQTPSFLNHLTVKLLSASVSVKNMRKKNQVKFL